MLLGEGHEGSEAGPRCFCWLTTRRRVVRARAWRTRTAPRVEAIPQAVQAARYGGPPSLMRALIAARKTSSRAKSSRATRIKGMDERWTSRGALAACHACAAMVLWSEYLLPGSTPLPPLTRQPAASLATACLVFAGAAVLLHVVGVLAPPRGWPFAVGNAAVAVVVLYAVGVLFGCPLLSVDCLAWAAYLAVACSLHERRKWVSTLVPKRGGRDWSRGEVPVMGVALASSWLGCFVIPLDWDR